MNNLREKNKKNRAFANSAQTGYFLLLSFILLFIIVTMIATNVGYDYIMDKADAVIRSGDKPTGIVKYIINTDAISKKISELIQYIILLEKNMSETLRFSSAQIMSFIVAFILSLIAIPSGFKNSLNANRRKSNKNKALNIILKLIAGIIFILLIITNIALQFLSTNIFITTLLQLLTYFILTLIIYYTLIKGKKSFKTLSISSIVSSIFIILSTYALKAITLILPMDGSAYVSMVYTTFFILSLVYIPYILITGKEIGMSIAEKK